jgi:Tfp pilus assembly protein PilX
MDSRMASARATVRDDQGASLILALVFLVVVSLITLAMAGFAATGLRSTISFTAAQSTVSSANSMAELALNESRHQLVSSTLYASPPASCWPSGGPTQQTFNAQSMSAWCSTRWNQLSTTATRRVTIDVCPTSFGATACAATPYLQVIVVFDDYSAAGAWACDQVTWTTCGTYMSIRSWVFGVNPPTLLSAQIPAITSTSGTCTTKSFTVTGTGFVAGQTSVYFVPPGQTSQPGNTAYSATGVQVLSGSTTTASGCVPLGLSGTWAVMVSTPLGQSQQVVSLLI